MKRKSLEKITILSVLISFLFTGGIFAYWASNASGDSESINPQINIGVGSSVETTVSLSEVARTQGSLVPLGYEEVGSVSEIVITYEVFLEANQDGANGTLANLQVTVGILPSDLLNVEVTQTSTQIVAGGEKVDVRVTITLDEPANVSEYNSVASLSFNIPLTFTASI